MGLMQIMPATGRDLARQTGQDGPLTSPSLNIMYGAVYMGQMVRFWTTPRPKVQTLRLAQASYNAGAGNILKAQRKSGNALFWCEISPHLIEITGRHSKETIDYVFLINRFYEQLINGR